MLLEADGGARPFERFLALKEAARDRIARRVDVVAARAGGGRDERDRGRLRRVKGHVGRRELDERLTALTALDAAYAETTHALAGLRAEHETLRIEYERVSRELRERCHTAEGRQQLAVQQLETLLARLRQ